MIDGHFALGSMDDLDKRLFAFAPCHAGPARAGKLSKEAARLGSDRNRWFHDVKPIAAERIGRERVG